jgi:hypothetical protein
MPADIALRPAACEAISPTARFAPRVSDESTMSCGGAPRTSVTFDIADLLTSDPMNPLNGAVSEFLRKREAFVASLPSEERVEYLKREHELAQAQEEEANAVQARLE